VYRDRLGAGVEWLLKQQLGDGSFPWWVSRTGMPETDHLYYKNGYAGIGLLEAYRHVPDQRILESVRRAADWTAAWRVSENNNYNSFACWILASYYRYNAQPRYLDAAVHKTLQGVLPRQLENGGWAGHNSWVAYQGIIVSGLVALLAALPADHPDHRAVEVGLISATNNLIVRQNEQGRLLATFDAQERREAEQRKIGYEKHPEFVADTHALLGLLWANDMLGYQVRPTIAGLMTAYGDDMRQQGRDDEGGDHGAHAMMLGYAWRWLVRQERLQITS